MVIYIYMYLYVYTYMYVNAYYQMITPIKISMFTMV